MARNLSPVPPFNAATQYFDSKTPSGLTTAGYQQFAQLQAAQGVAPVVSGVPATPQSGETFATGAFAFDPVANTLHLWNGQQWVSIAATVPAS